MQALKDHTDLLFQVHKHQYSSELCEHKMWTEEATGMILIDLGAKVHLIMLCQVGSVQQLSV